MPDSVLQPIQETVVFLLYSRERIWSRVPGLRVFVQELRDVRHDRFLIGLRYIDVLGVQQSRDAQLVLGNLESRFQASPIRRLSHSRYVHQVRLDGVDDRQEGISVSPTLAEVSNLDTDVPEEASPEFV